MVMGTDPPLLTSRALRNASVYHLLDSNKPILSLGLRKAGCFQYNKV